MESEYLQKIKKQLNKKDKHFTFKGIPKYMSKFLITTIVTLITLITLKANPSFKPGFYNKVYEENFSFAYINNIYEKYVGSPLPFKEFFKILDKSEPVFSENLVYTDSSEYMDGVKIVVGENYMIPAIDTGLVVFVGEKEGYGNTIIIEQQDGINVWYSNLNTISIKLYDYVKKGSLIGENKENYMYLVFKNNGEIVDYKNYI